MHNKLSEDGNSPEVLFNDMDSPLPPPQHHPPPLEMVTRTITNKVEVPKYEAFMMTGERVIKMSKNTQVKFILYLFPHPQCYFYPLFLGFIIT